MINRVVPAVKRNIQFTPMAVAFQLAIVDAGTAGQIPEEVARATFADVISGMLNGFGLLALNASIIPSQQPQGRLIWNPPGTIHPDFDAERSRSISILLCHCQTLQLPTELNLLISNLAEEAKTIKLDWFEFTFLPFLKTLGSTIQDLNIQIEQSPFRTLFQRVLTTYIERYVQPEPRPRTDWSRPTVVCECQDCPSLNIFLANANQQTCRFRLSGKRRDHMFSKVADTGIDQYTDTIDRYCHSLILTKNGNYFEVLHKSWVERSSVAKKCIQAMDSEIGLRPFLADLYDSIMSLSMVSSSTARDYRQLLPPPSASGGNYTQGQNTTQPLAPIANNVRGAREFPSLSSSIADDWKSLPPLGSHRSTETRILPPQGTKRKASEDLQQDAKRKAQGVIVIDG
jgi:hypothetical protein